MTESPAEEKTGPFGLGHETWVALGLAALAAAAKAGLNLVLLANLAGSAWFHLRFLRGRGSSPRSNVGRPASCRCTPAGPRSPPGFPRYSATFDGS